MRNDLPTKEQMLAGLEHIRPEIGEMLQRGIVRCQDRIAMHMAISNNGGWPNDFTESQKDLWRARAMVVILTVVDTISDEFIEIMGGDPNVKQPGER